MITGLGHVGIFVRDLEKMVAFYRDFLGLRVTKQNWRAGTVFLSADPQAATTRSRWCAEDRLTLRASRSRS